MKPEDLEEIQRTIKNNKPFYENGTYDYFSCESIEKLLNENQQLKKTINKALTLLQLIQMNDEVDWGDINTLINILKESEVK